MKVRSCAMATERSMALWEDYRRTRCHPTGKDETRRKKFDCWEFFFDAGYSQRKAADG
jgi:hypothetical protein